MISREVWEPCIACGAPVSVGGAGHDPGCPVMVTDVQIAASMALAAMDNRESWAYGAGGPGHEPPGQPQPRGSRTGAPLFLSAQWTAERGYAVWVLED